MVFEHDNLVRNFRKFLQARTAQASPLPQRPQVTADAGLLERARWFAARFGRNSETEIRELAALLNLDPEALSRTIVDPGTQARNNAWQPTLGAVVIELDRWLTPYMLVYREPPEGSFGGDDVILARDGSCVHHLISGLTFSGWRYATPEEIGQLPASRVLGFYAAYVGYCEKLDHDEALAMIDRTLLGGR